MGKFGWSYPPGCTQRMVDEAMGTEMPCSMCGRWADDCICPECPVCGEYGNPSCYADDNTQAHGLMKTRQQLQSLEELMAQEKARNDSEVAIEFEDTERYRKLMEELDEIEFQRKIDEGYFNE